MYHPKDGCYGLNMNNPPKTHVSRVQNSIIDSLMSSKLNGLLGSKTWLGKVVTWVMTFKSLSFLGFFPCFYFLAVILVQFSSATLFYYVSALEPAEHGPSPPKQ